MYEDHLSSLFCQVLSVVEFLDLLPFSAGSSWLLVLSSLYWFGLIKEYGLLLMTLLLGLILYIFFGMFLILLIYRPFRRHGLIKSTGFWKFLSLDWKSLFLVLSLLNCLKFKHN